jgi:hypothetical protein
MGKGTFVRTTRLVAIAVAGLVVSGTAASALVLVEKTEAQKLRADIQKQQHGLVSCLVKAATNCEKSGNLVASECDLATGTATAPADAKGKFAADIAKCESKLNFLKKAKTLDANTAYTAFGCPGDSDDGTAGDIPTPTSRAGRRPPRRRPGPRSTPWRSRSARSPAAARSRTSRPSRSARRPRSSASPATRRRSRSASSAARTTTRPRRATAAIPTRPPHAR